MIIVSLSGGLGNQLQQYALYRKFISMDVDARVDTSWYDDRIQATVAAKRSLELNRFCGIDYNECTSREREHFVGSGIVGTLCRRFGLDGAWIYREDRVFDPKLLKYTDKYVEGAFTCDCYYDDILPILRRELVFPIAEYENRAELNEIANDIRSHYSISIHIRRGDYLDLINNEIYGNICTEAYYLSSLDYCLKDTPDAKLYVFSDDPGYASEFALGLVEKNNKLGSYEVVNINNGDNSLFDIFLMSLCDCNITANSTFSYWGARLNGKENTVKIRPLRHKNSQAPSAEDMLKLLKGWVLIDHEGKVYK